MNGDEVIVDVAVPFGASGTIYTVEFYGTFSYSTDNGVTWTSSGNAVGGGIADRIAVDPLNSQVLTISSTKGITRSVDGGVSWLEMPIMSGTPQSTAGSSSSEITRMAHGAPGSGVLFAGSLGRGVQAMRLGSNFAISVSDLPDPIGVNQTLVYTVTIINTTGLDATDVGYRIDTGVGFTISDYITSQGAGCSHSGSVVTCELGALPVGGQATIQLGGVTGQPGTISSRFRLTGNLVDRSGSDGDQTVTTLISLDSDGDGTVDAIDTDDDNDGIADANDNCPLISNANQSNIDGDALGDACDSDRDGDGMPNSYETQYGLNPNSAADFNTDADGDGLTNGDEYQRGTRPDLADTDGDGVSDGAEVANGTDPKVNIEAVTTNIIIIQQLLMSE
ncbi:MAG: thrombospondin type 3 repeat-containing protein [Gammaproteobacteria bacterium]|nr:thrombospondin type 3 repeat-containing protein [Gammaproteobacteria bacterium]